MIYLYAIAEMMESEPKMIGLADQPVLSCRASELCAFFSRHTDGSFSPTADNVWRHEQIVEQLMGCRTLLPVRFGTSFPSVEALDEVLESNRTALRSGLERVRGKVELGVRVLGSVQPAVTDISAVTGTDYMRQRAEEEHRRGEQKLRARRLADSIHQPLSLLAAESTQREPDDSMFVLTAAYLVDRDQIGAFRDCVRALSEVITEIRVLCTGPWPPYHFVPRLRPLEACHA